MDVVVALDVSPSMARPTEHVKPSKLSVARDALAYAVSRMLTRNPTARVGLVLFYGHAYPVLPLTNDLRAFSRTLALAKVLGSGTAPGDALIASVKMLRRSVGERRVVIVTDGGFNEGIRLDYAAYYAKNSSVVVDVVTIGDEPPGKDRGVIEATVKLTGGRWMHAVTREDLYRILQALLSTSPQ
jgi:Ca-activated chloride channel family protein